MATSASDGANRLGRAGGALRIKRAAAFIVEDSYFSAEKAAIRSIVPFDLRDFGE